MQHAKGDKNAPVKVIAVMVMGGLIKFKTVVRQQNHPSTVN